VSINDIFLVARLLSAGESRGQYLAEVIGDDQALRYRIDCILASENSAATLGRRRLADCRAIGNFASENPVAAAFRRHRPNGRTRRE